MNILVDIYEGIYLFNRQHAKSKDDADRMASLQAWMGATIFYLVVNFSFFYIYYGIFDAPIIYGKPIAIGSMILYVILVICIRVWYGKNYSINREFSKSEKNVKIRRAMYFLGLSIAMFGLLVFMPLLFKYLFNSRH